MYGATEEDEDGDEYFEEATDAWMKFADSLKECKSLRRLAFRRVVDGLVSERSKIVVVREGRDAPWTFDSRPIAKPADTTIAEMRL
jgi:hypothetical protein